ncbi:PstS family phosphate ABC transporter substrate-binding protein [Methylocaldum sp. MU1018]
MDDRDAGGARFGFDRRRSLIRRGLVPFIIAALFGGSADAARISAAYGGTEAIRDVGDEIGSSELDTLIRHWAGAFRRDHAGAAVLLRPAASLAAPGAFDEAHEHAMYVGYRLNRAAIDGFAKKYGYRPAPVRVALDTIAIFVHRENPIRGLTLAQVASVFSSSPRCHGALHSATWGALGLAGEWRTRPLQLFGIGPAGDVYDYFREQALCGDEASRLVRALPDSAAVIRAVSESSNAIGYGRGGLSSDAAKTVPLAVQANMPFVAPAERHAVDGTYPLTRFLYIYINKHPDRPLPERQAAFVRFVLSVDGQGIARRNGYIPVPRDVAEKEQNRLFADRP